MAILKRPERLLNREASNLSFSWFSVLGEASLLNCFYHIYAMTQADKAGNTNECRWWRFQALLRFCVKGLVFSPAILDPAKLNIGLSCLSRARLLISEELRMASDKSAVNKSAHRDDAFSFADPWPAVRPSSSGATSRSPKGRKRSRNQRVIS